MCKHNEVEKNNKIIENIKKAILNFLGTEKEISLNTLFEIRECIQSMTEKEYQNNYRQTYDYDKKKDRIQYYEDDNIYIGEFVSGANGKKFHITECAYYISKYEKISVKLEKGVIVEFCPERFVAKDGGYTYLYLNEIDHFFTFYITKYLVYKQNKESGKQFSIRGNIRDLAVKEYMWKDLKFDD